MICSFNFATFFCQDCKTQAIIEKFLQSFFANMKAHSKISTINKSLVLSVSRMHNLYQYHPKQVRLIPRDHWEHLLSMMVKDKLEMEIHVEREMEFSCVYMDASKILNYTNTLIHINISSFVLWNRIYHKSEAMLWTCEDMWRAHRFQCKFYSCILSQILMIFVIIKVKLIFTKSCSQWLCRRSQNSDHSRAPRGVPNQCGKYIRPVLCP